MKLHELKPAKGAVKAKRRLGRGTATGQGKTAGRGQKGQWSRSGGGNYIYEEGESMYRMYLVDYAGVDPEKMV